MYLAISLLMLSNVNKKTDNILMHPQWRNSVEESPLCKVAIHPCVLWVVCLGLSQLNPVYLPLRDYNNLAETGGPQFDIYT